MRLGSKVFAARALIRLANSVPLNRQDAKNAKDSQFFVSLHCSLCPTRFALCALRHALCSRRQARVGWGPFLGFQQKVLVFSEGFW
jgi:hypothetical protein